MASIWASILGDLPPDILDDSSVRTIQGLCPDSHVDRGLMHKAFAGSQFFRRVVGYSERDRLFFRILNTKGTIPTFWTLNELSKAFEPCCFILRTLFEPDAFKDDHGYQQTLQKNFSSCYKAGRAMLQVNESDLREVVSARPEDGFMLAYIQLWIFCLRHFPYMSSLGPRLETSHRRAKSHRTSTEPILWSMLAELALALGFDSTRIREMLLSNRGRLPQLSPISGEPTAHLEVGRRLGRPYEDDHGAMRANFFLLYIVTEARPMNHAFVYREIFARCFHMETAVSYLSDAEPLRY